MNKRIQIYIYSIITTSFVIQCFYVIQVTFVYQKPYFGFGLFAPIIVGLVTGLMIGKLINQYQQIKQNKNYKSLLLKQEILNEILLLSKQNLKLSSFLDKVLDIILVTPFAKIKSKGGVFMKQGKDSYKIVCSKNLDPEISGFCGKKGIKSGECLCGLSIKHKKTIFKQCVDHDHTISYEGMKNHGHYNVPIIHRDVVYGVLVLYLEENHIYDQQEVDFLESIAGVLALVFYRNESDNKLQESNTVIENVKDITGFATWQFVLDTEEVYWSDKVYEMLDYEPQSRKLDINFLNSVIYEKDREKYKNAIKKAKSGTPFQLEIKYLNRHGKTLYVINQCTPQFDFHGDVERLTGILFDITHIRENQNQLHEKDEFIESIVSASPFSLGLLDIKNNKILYSNTQFDKSVNKVATIAFEDGGLKTWRKSIHPEDVHLFIEIEKEIEKGNKPIFELNARFTHDGKNYRWVSQKFTPYKVDEKGKITHLLTLGIDIHRQKKADENILNLNKELQIQNKELIKTHAELDNFIYSSTHDLRAPIASILGLTNLYSIETEQILRNQYVDHIDFSAKKLDNVIQEILEYARNAKIELEIEEINIGQLVSNVYDNLEFAYLDTEISFEILNPNSLNVFSDSLRLKMMLNNILGNAIKFIDKSKANHEIKCTISEKQKGINIQISDNGIGIDNSYLHRIFDMFYRAVNSSMGSGLGLYIAKESINKISGIIDINSEIGKYTEVDIYIPNLPQVNSEK